MQEPVQADLEREKFEWQVESQKRDLALRERDLSWKIEEARRSRWTSPLFLAVAAAVVGLFGNGIVAVIQGANSVRLKERETADNLRLEKEKLTSNLILEAIKTGEAGKAARNLLFLSEIGLITQDRGKLAKYLETPENIPVLPSANPTPSGPLTFSLSNSCDSSVRAVVSYFDNITNTWKLNGWLNISATLTSSLVIPPSGRSKVGVYAETLDGKMIWEGGASYEQEFEGKRLRFRIVDISNAHDRYSDILTCAK